MTSKQYVLSKYPDAVLGKRYVWGQAVRPTYIIWSPDKELCHAQTARQAWSMAAKIIKEKEARHE